MAAEYVTGKPFTLIEISIKALVDFIIKTCKDNESRFDTAFCTTLRDHFMTFIPQQTWIWEKWTLNVLRALEDVEQRPRSFCQLVSFVFGSPLLRIDLDSSSALREVPESLYSGIGNSLQVRSFSSTKETLWAQDPKQLERLGNALSTLKHLKSVVLNNVGVNVERTRFCTFVLKLVEGCPQLKELDLSNTPFCATCSEYVAGGCPNLERLRLRNTKMTKVAAMGILIALGNLKTFEATKKFDVSISSSVFWQMLRDNSPIAAKLENIEIGHGITEPFAFSSPESLRATADIKTLVYRNAVSPSAFRLPALFPNLREAVIIYDEDWELPLIALLPLLEIVLLNGLSFPVTFTFKSVGMFDILILERLGQFFPLLVNLTLIKPEPNYGEPYSQLIQRRYFRHLETLHYEGCLYPPHALILLSSCANLRQLTLFTDILPLGTVRMVLQSNSMEHLEELRLGLQKDLTIETIQLFVDATPRLKILGRTFWWQALTKQGVEHICGELRRTRWALQIIP